MTVIAWDGKSLAADKRAVSSGLARTTTKIFRVGDALVGFAGDAGNGKEMLEWARSGFNPDTYPASQRDKDLWDVFVVIDATGVRAYEKTPHAVYFEDTFWATGSGRDYAIAAMHFGKSAREAVEVACLFDNGCGNGVDELTL